MYLKLTADYYFIPAPTILEDSTIRRELLLSIITKLHIPEWSQEIINTRAYFANKV